MWVRSGIESAHVVERLRACAQDAENLKAGPSELQQRKTSYAGWVDATERILRNLFVAFDPARLYTARSWRIRDITTATERPYDLINLEIEVQVEWLNDLASAVDLMSRAVRDPPGQIAVLDTNVLLHFRPLGEIPWATVVDAPVRLVVPLRAIEELDQKQLSRNSALAKRAGKALRRLEKVVADTPTSPSPLRDDTTIEVFEHSTFAALDLPAGALPIRTPMPPDTEIIAAARLLNFLSGSPTVIVTGDVSMRIRASTAGLIALPLSDQYRTPLSQDPA